VTAIALLGLSNATAAEEMYVVCDGKLNKEALDWPEGLTPERPYIPGHHHGRLRCVLAVDRQPASGVPGVAGLTSGGFHGRQTA